MKWIALAFAIASILPLAGWIRKNPANRRLVWVTIGFMPFALGLLHLDMSVIDWSTWPGYAKGLQISLIDLVAVSLFLARPRDGFTLPFRGVIILYSFAVLLSIFQAQVPMAAVFYAWQTARVFFVYVVVAHACTDSRVVGAILIGMTAGLCVQAALAIWQRAGLGILQTSGSFGHQNGLGFISHFVVYPAFAVLLGRDRPWLPMAAVLSGLIIAVLTTSRATFGLVAIGLLLVFIILVFQGWTQRKAAVLATGALVVLALIPIALQSFERRFSESPLSEEYDERAAFEKAASLILSDHPLGTGANNYVFVANMGGYFDKAEVAPTNRSRGTLVHNAYWVAAAETGYFGVFSFVLLLANIIFVALRCGWAYRRDIRGHLLLGIGVSLVIVAIHSLYEWVLFYAPMQYCLALSAGMVAGLATKLGYWRPRGKSHYRPALFRESTQPDGC